MHHGTCRFIGLERILFSIDACEDDLASPHDYPMDILNLVAVRDFNFSVGDFLW